ncbi:WD repeat-containing protein [Aureococcus anophagefferens]|nr:WD repeat-containing protein [Aureococcus anophagefferens]
MITSITTEGVLKALAWHPENTAIASGGFCAAVTVWKMNVDEEKPKEEILWRNELENIAADCRSLAYSADGTKLVVAFCSDDRQVHFWPRDDKTRLPIGAEEDVE